MTGAGADPAGSGVVVTLTVTPDGFAASSAFYDAALGALGLVRVSELVDEEEDDVPVEAVGWGETGAPASVWLVVGIAPTTGLHLRVPANSRHEVETLVDKVVSTTGSVTDHPRRWTPYRRGEFSATVADPQGNLLEAVAPE